MRHALMVLAVALTTAACIGSSSAPTSVGTSSSGRGSSSAASLDRRLRFRRLAPNQACPRTSGGYKAKGVAVALGHGPVYPVLGMSAAPPAPGGVAGLRSDYHVLGWYLHKTLWAISPTYSGPVLIRGGRVDRAGLVRFGGDAATPRAMVQTSTPVFRMTADGSREWRYYPTETLLRAAGCYAFQVDGADFSYVIVFRASAAGDWPRLRWQLPDDGGVGGRQAEVPSR